MSCRRAYGFNIDINFPLCLLISVNKRRALAPSRLCICTALIPLSYSCSLNNLLLLHYYYSVLRQPLLLLHTSAVTATCVSYKKWPCVFSGIPRLSSAIWKSLCILLVSDKHWALGLKRQSHPPPLLSFIMFMRNSTSPGWNFTLLGWNSMLRVLHSSQTRDNSSAFCNFFTDGHHLASHITNKG